MLRHSWPFDEQAKHFEPRDLLSECGRTFDALAACQMRRRQVRGTVQSGCISWYMAATAGSRSREGEAPDTFSRSGTLPFASAELAMVFPIGKLAASI
jgi:hypothetical protein